MTPHSCILNGFKRTKLGREAHQHEAELNIIQYN